MGKEFYIWPDLGLYCGESFSTVRHSHFFSQICCTLNEGPVRLQGSDGEWKEYETVFVPSRVSHRTEQTSEKFIILLVDPLGIGKGIFRNLKIQKGEPGLEVGDQIPVQEIRNTFKEGDPNHTRKRILELLDSVRSSQKHKVMDPRIQNSLSKISAEEFSLTEIAKGYGLSQSRFRHLFREETGITFSEYKIWTKIRKAILYLSTQPQLVQAALEGGFADQAHFTRIFKNSFGLRPSDFFQKEENFAPRFFPD
ncbi:helix-turn-helix domain-containing protein [Leptospira koniambonensis]|uniref:Helix-turn-helix domain-containing protein n=1 Tax=Leptospira koniambonensis TaxID=2484950 RepID=A0A4R9JA97_9LEPT|nr:helix-turn-helix domain-containing protein [Leptospira koniambonensis]TGL36311.1 helix-turn-helix domain-containing protein [Leptospira koniambonensis]